MISMSTPPLGPIRTDRAANVPAAGPGDDSFGNILDRHVADDPAATNERGQRDESSPSSVPGSAAAANDRGGRRIAGGRPTPDVDEPSDADDPDTSDATAPDREETDASRLGGTPTQGVPVVSAPTGPAVAAPAPAPAVDIADPSTAAASYPVPVVAAVDALTTTTTVLLPTPGTDGPSDVPGSSATHSAESNDAPMPTIRDIAVEVVPAPTASAAVTHATTRTPAATDTAPPSPNPSPDALVGIAAQVPAAPDAIAHVSAESPSQPAATARVPSAGAPATSSPRTASQGTSTPVADTAVAIGASGTAPGSAPTARPTADTAAAPVGDGANGFGSIAGTTMPAMSTAASTAAATTTDLAVDGPTAPLRTIDLAAHAQRDAQIRRAEQLTRLDIDVTTEGLGAIRIEAANAGGGLQLNLGAERASTRHLLVEQAAVLRDELGGATVSVDIGRGRRDAPSDHARDHRSHPNAASASVTATGASIVPRRAAVARLLDADRGLDLHL